MKHFYLIISDPDARSVRNTKEDLIRCLDHYGDAVTYDVHEGRLERDFEIPDSVDCLITLGGDGTMLRASRAAVRHDVAMIGINRGHIGYLTEMTEIQDVEEFIDRLVNDNFMIEERMMLDAKMYRDGELVFRDKALNDVMIGKNDFVHMMEYDVIVNGILLNTYKADGIVISSPTGSTGYSMSAGGPIAEPSAKLLILTPICPHAINNRAMVLSAEDEIRVISRKGEMLISCDGADGTLVLRNDEIVVRRSKYVTKFIKFRKTSFLEALQTKMRSI